MEDLGIRYRESIYSEMVELSKDKVYIVKSSLDDRIYIKKKLSHENIEIYEKLKELDLPNTPKIYEVIILEEELLIIEEYINGYSLEEVLEREGELSEGEVIDHSLALINILEGLYSNNSKIIHRDIKPSNIMINNDGILKLIDFNISRIHKSNKSNDTEVLGTYGFAAPEQFGFKQSDIRTDIYSLGATMNILLTGKLPREELYKGKLSRIILKCIEIDPEKRYQSIEEVRNELLNIHRDISRKLGRENNRPLGLAFRFIGFLWYLVLGLAALGFLDKDGISQERASNITFSLILFLFTAMFTNMKGIRYRLPILNSNKIYVVIFGYIFYTLILLMLAGILIPS